MGNYLALLPDFCPVLCTGFPFTHPITSALALRRDETNYLIVVMELATCLKTFLVCILLADFEKKWR